MLISIVLLFSLECVVRGLFTVFSIPYFVMYLIYFMLRFSGNDIKVKYLRPVEKREASKTDVFV